MQLADNTSTTDTIGLRSEVSSFGTSSDVPSYDIAPEDQHIADSIRSVDVNDIPTPHEIPEGWTMAPLRLTALPPAMQTDIRHRLASYPPEQRAAREHEFTAEVLRSMRTEARVLTGVGVDATPYHREVFALTRELRDLHTDYKRIAGEVEEVERYDPATNPETGEAMAIPVYRLQGTRLRAAREQLDEIGRRIRLLAPSAEGSEGFEARARLKQAMFESVKAVKAVRQQREDEAEAQRRAAHLAREERINKRAESRARMLRNGS